MEEWDREEETTVMTEVMTEEVYGGPYPDNRRVLIQNRFEQLGNNSDSDGNMQENFPPYNPNDKWYSVKNKGTGKNSNYRKQKNG